ncbi:unnamed protein product, partial [Discosporangium mesarthrocarpum]
MSTGTAAEEFPGASQQDSSRSSFEVSSLPCIVPASHQLPRDGWSEEWREPAGVGQGIIDLDGRLETTAPATLRRRVNKRLRIANQSPEERATQKARHALAERRRRAALSPEERALQRERRAEAERKRLALLSEEDRKAQRERHAKAERDRRANMTPEQRERQRERRAEALRRRRAAQTPEERQLEKEEHARAERLRRASLTPAGVKCSKSRKANTLNNKDQVQAPPGHRAEGGVEVSRGEPQAHPQVQAQLLAPPTHPQVQQAQAQVLVTAGVSQALSHGQAVTRLQPPEVGSGREENAGIGVVASLASQALPDELRLTVPRVLDGHQANWGAGETTGAGYFSRGLRTMLPVEAGSSKSQQTNIMTMPPAMTALSMAHRHKADTEGWQAPGGGWGEEQRRVTVAEAERLVWEKKSQDTLSRCSLSGPPAVTANSSEPPVSMAAALTIRHSAHQGAISNNAATAKGCGVPQVSEAWGVTAGCSDMLGRGSFAGEATLTAATPASIMRTDISSEDCHAVLTGAAAVAIEAPRHNSDGSIGALKGIFPPHTLTLAQTFSGGSQATDMGERGAFQAGGYDSHEQQKGDSLGATMASSGPGHPMEAFSLV